MPRSIQEILDQAEELAQRFENYEPNANDERPVEEYMLEHAALARARSERQVADAVIAARASGASWQKIGSLLGTSAQAAQQRYGALIDASDRKTVPNRRIRVTAQSVQTLHAAALVGLGFAARQHIEVVGDVEHLERSADADAEADSHGQLDDLGVGEELVQPFPHGVVDAGVIDRELLGELGPAAHAA